MKKIIAVLLMATFVVSSLTACGSSGQFSERTKRRSLNNLYHKGSDGLWHENF